MDGFSVAKKRHHKKSTRKSYRECGYTRRCRRSASSNVPMKSSLFFYSLAFSSLLAHPALAHIAPTSSFAPFLDDSSDAISLTGSASAAVWFYSTSRAMQQIHPLHLSVVPPSITSHFTEKLKIACLDLVVIFIFKHRWWLPQNPRWRRITRSSTYSLGRIYVV